MKLIIAGSTGQLGKAVMVAAARAGHETVGISRATGVDLMTGAGLNEALRGAYAVIDVSSTTSTKTQDSIDFFGTVTRNLLAAEKEAGVAHHVAISIIGAAKINANYYAGKKVQEDLLLERDGGWSLLRTSQFHDFVKQVIPAGKLGPFQLVPTMRYQPVAIPEVAAELVRIATNGPLGVVPELAGPREENLSESVRKYLGVVGEKRAIIQMPLPGAWGRGMRDGTLLPAPGGHAGSQTFDEWLRAL